VDIFAAGILLYEMLTLQRLFMGDSDVETLEAVKRAVVPRLTLHNPSVTPALEEICVKALQKEPPLRYASGGAMADSLARAGAEAAGGARAVAAVLQELFANDKVKEKELQREYNQKLVDAKAIRFPTAPFRWRRRARPRWSSSSRRSPSPSGAPGPGS